MGRAKANILTDDDSTGLYAKFCGTKCKYNRSLDKKKIRKTKSHIGIGNMMAKCTLKIIWLIKCVVCSLMSVENHWFLWNFDVNILARTDYLLENNEDRVIHFE